MTVLEKVGITQEKINELREEGLVVPWKIEPFRHAFRTPGEDWVYYAADVFTPPLSQEEKELYIRDPKLFCQELIAKLRFFSKVSGLLFEAARQVESKLRADAALAAYWAILHIFDACGVYAYYKYDSHFEYYEYEESPVGYYYKKLKKFCSIADRRKNVQRTQEWAEEQMLKILTSPIDDRIGMNIEYLLSCKELQKKISKSLPGFQGFSPQDLLKIIESGDRLLYDQIIERAKSFFKTPIELVGDCLEEIDFGEDDIRMSKEMARKAYSEILAGLNQKEKEEFTEVLEIVHEFVLTHQKEVFIATGITPSGNHLFETFFDWFKKIKELMGQLPQFIAQEYTEQAADVLKEENPVVGGRILLSKGQEIFNERIRKLFSQEIRRWA